MSDAGTKKPVVAFKRKKRQRKSKGQMRQRESDSDEADDGVVGGLPSAKSRRRAKETAEAGSLLAEQAVKSARTKESEQTGGAVTSTLETETERDRDAVAIRQRHIAESTGDSEAGVYRGQGAYKSYTKRDVEAATSGNKVSGAHGPIRAPAHIRNVSLFDYQRDICKDYKETGFCSFGDTCIYLHERADYKTGWQLEDEWKVKEKKREARLMRGVDPDVETDEGGDDDTLPFACLICRNPFRRPVRTLCGHYFCESCALDHYRKTSLCFACKAPTSGVFNHSKDMEKRMASQAAAQQGTAEQAGDTGTAPPAVTTGEWGDA